MISVSTALALLLFTGIFGIALGYLMRFLQMTIAKAQLEVNVRKTLNKARDKATKIVAESYQQTEGLRSDLDKRYVEISTREVELKTHLELHQKQSLDLVNQVNNAKAAAVLYQRKLEHITDGSLVSKPKIIKEWQTNIDHNIESYYQQKTNNLESRYEKKLEELIIKHLPEVTRRSVRNNTSISLNISDNEVGKIIGKDGINIKAFERFAGVDVVIDSTNSEVTLSSFSPKRRLIAKQSLVELLDNGRISRDSIQQKIEEIEKRFQYEAEKLVNEGVVDLGLGEELPTAITKQLSELYFRHSYGQNQLEHSLEVADLAGRIMNEFNPSMTNQAKLAGLLHDIGKSLEQTSDHVGAGIKFLRHEMTALDEKIFEAINEHHDQQANSLLSAILQTADTVSSGRPGARAATTANYISRLEKIEKFIANYDTVDNVYAISGGREVFIIAKNKDFTHDSLLQLANIISKDLKDANLVHQPITLRIIREDEVVKTVA